MEVISGKQGNGDSQHWIKLLSWSSLRTTLRNPIKCSQRYFPNRHKGKTSSSIFCWPGVLTSLSLCSENPTSEKYQVRKQVVYPASLRRGVMSHCIWQGGWVPRNCPLGAGSGGRRREDSKQPILCTTCSAPYCSTHSEYQVNGGRL